MLLRTLVVASAAALLGASLCEASTYYVSATASANNTACTFSAPCLRISQALTAASVGDSIVCLTAPLGGPIEIFKSVTIDCGAPHAAVRDGGYATSRESTVIAVYISVAVSTSDPLRTVRLRGLTIDGAYATTYYPTGYIVQRGVYIDDAAAVYIEDCVISNASQQGIFDRRTGGQTKLYVKDTVISGNGGPGIVALSAATAITVLDNVSLFNNTYGLAVGAGNNVAITRSAISGNTTAGVEADSGAQVNVSNSVISHNNVGVQYGGGTLRLRDSDIEFNNTAVQGAAVSGGANRFFGNGALGTTPGSASGAPADVYN